jgi:hypothetical protein
MISYRHFTFPFLGCSRSSDSGKVEPAVGQIDDRKLIDVGDLPIALPSHKAPALLGRARIGVRFHVAPLFVYNPAQLPFHYLECVVYYLRQRLMRAVIDLFFFRDQFVARRDGDVNPHAELVSFFVSVIRLLDSNVAPADVIAEFV